MSYRETFLRVEKMLYGGLAHEPHYSLTPRNAVSDRGKAPTADIAPRLIPNVRPTADDPLKSGQPISRVGRRCNVCPPVSAVHAEARLGITIYSDNPEATLIYNQPQASNEKQTTIKGEGAGNFGGYLVDQDGNIIFHSVGVLNVAGLTRLQFKQMLQDTLRPFLTHPYADIRFMNKRITVLGEVTKPGMINMPEEKISVLDALAMSGDMTNFGRRDNVLVVREENGKRSSQRLNLKDPAIYKSDFFYLHSDDMVYVEPNRKKPTGNDATLVRNLSITATLISTLAILYSIFK